MDSDFMWHRFDDDHRTALCYAAIDCYWPLLGNPLLPEISEQHSLENGGSHCPTCCAAVAEVDRYSPPAIVAEVPRNSEGMGEPYRWNENRVCVNPDMVYQAQQSKKDNLTLTAAMRPDGQWSTGYDYNYAKGPGGSSSPVSLSGLGYDTKDDAIKAQAAALWLRPGTQADLHKALLAALYLLANPLGEPTTMAEPKSTRPLPVLKTRPTTRLASTSQLSLF